MDIDITVAMQPNNLDKLIACAESLNLKPVLPIPLSSLKNLELLKLMASRKKLAGFCTAHRRISWRYLGYSAVSAD